MNTRKRYPSKIFQGSYRGKVKKYLNFAKRYVSNGEPRKYVLKYNHTCGTGSHNNVYIIDLEVLCNTQNIDWFREAAQITQQEIIRLSHHSLSQILPTDGGDYPEIKSWRIESWVR